MAPRSFSLTLLLAFAIAASTAAWVFSSKGRGERREGGGASTLLHELAKYASHMTQLDHQIGRCMPWQLHTPELSLGRNRAATDYVPAPTCGKEPLMDDTNSAPTERTINAHREGPRSVRGRIRQSGTMTPKVLLVCGILSSLLYVATLVVAPMLWENYSSTSQTVSELFGIGAPSRPLVVALFLTYGVLVIAFGLGVWGSAGRRRSLRITGGLLVAYGVVGLAGPFFPIHLRKALAAGEGSLTDTMHGIITMVLVLFMLLAIGFGAAAFGKRFRLYSIVTIVLLVVGGVLAGLDQPRLEANLPTPWMGVTERINIGVFLLWVVVLAIALLRAQVESADIREKHAKT